jgi:hypothetical protein
MDPATKKNMQKNLHTSLCGIIVAGQNLHIGPDGRLVDESTLVILTPRKEAFGQPSGKESDAATQARRLSSAQCEGS